MSLDPAIVPKKVFTPRGEGVVGGDEGDEGDGASKEGGGGGGGEKMSP